MADPTEAWEIYEKIERAWWMGDRNARFPGGEDLPSLLSRLKGFFEEVGQLHSGGTTVAVGHGGILRAAISQLFEGADTVEEHMANGSVTRLELERASGQLKSQLVSWGELPPNL